MNLYKKSTQIGLVILLVLQIAIFSGCEQYEEFTNDPPEITNLTVPAEVEYGETVQLRIRAFDADDDDTNLYMGCLRRHISQRHGARSSVDCP